MIGSFTFTVHGLLSYHTYMLLGTFTMLKCTCKRYSTWQTAYDAPNTKDAEHSRRVASSREVLIEDTIQVAMFEQEFLGNTANKVRFIALLVSHLLVDSLLFVHAATGCHTTSAGYRKCKRVPFRKLQAQPAVCPAVQVFNDPRASRNAIAAAGEAFLCVVYGWTIDDNLDIKRHQLYLRTIAKPKMCAKFDLATLPPTSATGRQQSFHQVEQWRGVALDPTDWGRKLNDRALHHSLHTENLHPRQYSTS